MLLDIAEVARKSGLPASALRHYEEKRLIHSVGRRGLRRLFDAKVLERLALIALGQASGFSLDEMARLFSADGRPRIDRAMLVAKADELERKIRRLTALREGLRHAAVCTAATHLECPTFRRLLKVAARVAHRKGASAGSLAADGTIDAPSRKSIRAARVRSRGV